MFDIGWAELLVIGAVMLIVVGPKDLPQMLRTMGQYAGKARAMAREFQRTMEDAAKEADLGELRDVQRSMSDFNRKIGMNPAKKGLDSLMKDDAAPAAATKGSLDEADAAENAAWKAEQEAEAAPPAPDAVPTPTKPAAAQPSAPSTAAPTPPASSQPQTDEAPRSRSA